MDKVHSRFIYLESLGGIVPEEHEFWVLKYSEGYHLRSRSIPAEEVKSLGDVSSTSTSHATTEGPVERQLSEGQSQVSVGVIYLPLARTHLEEAISNRSVTTMRPRLPAHHKNPLTSVPRETLQRSWTRRWKPTLVSAVGASTSLAIGQTTHTAIGLGIGVNIGEASAPVASGFPSTSPLSPMAVSSQLDFSVAMNDDHYERIRVCCRLCLSAVSISLSKLLPFFEHVNDYGCGTVLYPGGGVAL